MGKRYETKRAILDMLSAKQGTMTDISRVLGLSHSTVSQHLKELESTGEIEMLYNPHFRKLKYYSIRNPLGSLQYGGGLHTPMAAV
ncbi:MAG: winged helix-turn-helix transcriptional regulator [Candidatus Micrarchaeota archaeon]|nr:winged helix-turn-helix transcriptional regulator [Candidatus Micrarchaeota archaeon]